MSWLSGLKSKSVPSQAEIREEKRQKLEAERLQRAQNRNRYQKQLQEAQKAREEADQVLQQFLDIAIDLFDDDDTPIDASVNVDINDIVTMVNFDEENADNGADAMKNLGQIKVKWNAENPEFFFAQLETELQIFSILKQFTKRQALIRSLPEEVALEFMHLICLQETKAGDKPYKDLKTALLKAYGPRPGDAFQRALSRVMVGKPSALLKLLISDICESNLEKCCCHKTVWGLFQLQIPLYLKTGLANEVLSTESLSGIMERADNLWSANQDKQISTVSVTAKAVAKVNVTETDSEIAAVGRGRGNSNARGRGFRGRGRGYQGQGRGSQNGPDPRGKRHESNPPWNSCSAHWVYADKAFKCQSPTTCPMKDKITPKTNQA